MVAKRRDALDVAAWRERRTRLRITVLRLGRLLGWERREVIAFTQALTHRPWHWCGCAELEVVVEEFLALGRAIKGKRTRRGGRHGG